MKKTIGVLGAGTMGAGIAQVAAQSGHNVVLVDLNTDQLDKAKSNLAKTLSKLVEKGKIADAQKIEIESNIRYTSDIIDFSSCGLIIEAIVEDLAVKHKVFESLEKIVAVDCILASNTSSLSIASIGGSLQKANRIIGIHFFNPAPLMPLVEVIPAVQTDQSTCDEAVDLMKSWGKTVVVCKDTPGFIVNRVARPFYGEALRIYEEGIADFATIDWAMTEIGGFKMGPFTLMDYIGNDINYAVTESVFQAFYYDPRFKPSFTQKRHSEAGFFGRKTGRGYYDYSEGANIPIPTKDYALGQQIVDRILAMLINEAYDAVFMQVATAEAVDLAMTKGVNYPKGLIEWSKEIGTKEILNRLETLFSFYGEDRYRPNPLLKREVLH
ncbi:MAG: 3-hydroxyacyl-CoA dehydrogenase NAD-binding domain-containing protein [Crocinitomicaceae bacterium]